MVSWQAEVGSPSATVAFVTSVLSKYGTNGMNRALSRLSLDGGGPPPVSCATTSWLGRSGCIGFSREHDATASAAAAEKVRNLVNRANMKGLLGKRSVL